MTNEISKYQSYTKIQLGLNLWSLCYLVSSTLSNSCLNFNHLRTHCASAQAIPGLLQVSFALEMLYQ